MTVKEKLRRVVTPANAGVQTLIWDELICCSNYETLNKVETPMPGAGIPKHENIASTELIRSSFRRKPESRDVRASWIPDRVRDDSEKQMPQKR